MMHLLRKGYLAQGLYGFIARFVTILLRFPYIILIAQLLTTEEFSAYVYSTALYNTLIFMLLMNSHAVVIREFTIRSPDVLRSDLVVKLMFAVGLSVLLVPIAMLDPSSELAVMLVVLAVVPRMICLWSEIAFLCVEKNHYNIVLYPTMRGVELAAVVAFAFGGIDIVEILIIHVISWWLQAAASLYFVRRYYPVFSGLVDIKHSLSVYREGFRGLFSFVGQTYLFSMLLIAGKFLSESPDVYANYSVILVILLLIVDALDSFANAAIPRLAEGGLNYRHIAGLLLGICALGLFADLVYWAINIDMIGLVLGEKYGLASSYFQYGFFTIMVAFAVRIIQKLEIARENYLVLDGMAFITLGIASVAFLTTEDQIFTNGMLAMAFLASLPLWYVSCAGKRKYAGE